MGRIIIVVRVRQEGLGPVGIILQIFPLDHHAPVSYTHLVPTYSIESAECIKSIQYVDAFDTKTREVRRMTTEPVVQNLGKSLKVGITEMCIRDRLWPTWK